MTNDEAIRILREFYVKFPNSGGELLGLAVDKAVEALNRQKDMIGDIVDGTFENPEYMYFRVVSGNLPAEFILDGHLHLGDDVKLMIMKWED